MQTIDVKHVAYVERYTSIQEFEQVFDSRRTRVDDGEDHFAMNYRSSDEWWSGYSDGASLRSDFEKSRVNDNTLTAMQSDLSQVKMAPQTRVRHYNAEAGIMVDTDAYLNGDPECFINIRKEKSPGRTIKVLVNTGVVCSLSVEEITEGGRAIVKALAGLESKGFRTELSVGWLMGMPPRKNSQAVDRVGGMTILVKRSSEPFNLTRIAWPMITPAFSRGVGFGWYDRCDKIPYGSHYGRAYNYIDSYIVDEFEKQLNKKGEIVLSVDRVCNWIREGRDVEEAIKNEVDRAIALSKEVRH